MLWNRMLQEAVVHVNNVANVPFGTTVVNDWLYWNDFKFKSVWTWRLFKKQCERYGIKLFTSIIKLYKALLTWATIHITYWKTLVFFFFIRWSCKQLFKKFFFNLTYNSTIQACSKSLFLCHCYQTVTSDIQLHRH